MKSCSEEDAAMEKRRDQCDQKSDPAQGDSLQGREALVLLSGGLDSATVLALCVQQGYRPHCLSFSYGQRHNVELEAAARVATYFDVLSHHTIPIALNEMGGSALTDHCIAVPDEKSDDIPITYVPARNTIFLALALGYAEVLGLYDIFIGVNAVDYSGYPDCRPEYIEAFQRMADLATREGVEGRPIQIHAPIIHLSKAEIIRRGLEAGVDYSLTISCYNAEASGEACGECDSCRLRLAGFAALGQTDPAPYRNKLEPSTTKGYK
jgi:7-cyano-7-deazaguanine synthase